MRGQHQGDAFRPQLAQDGVKRAGRFRVEAVGWLVQKEDLRPAEQGLGKAETLAHALGIFAHAPLGRVGEPDPLEECGAVLHRRAL